MVTHNNCYIKIIPGHQFPRQGGQKLESEYNFSVVVGCSYCKTTICFKVNQEKKKKKIDNEKQKSRVEWSLPKLQLMQLFSFFS